MPTKTHNRVLTPPPAQGWKQRNLNRVFIKYLEESIADEQVERVLTPALAMIRMGAFDHSKH